VANQRICHILATSPRFLQNYRCTNQHEQRNLTVYWLQKISIQAQYRPAILIWSTERIGWCCRYSSNNPHHDGESPRNAQSRSHLTGTRRQENHAGFMASTDAVCMLEHYFQITLNDKEVARVAATIDGDTREPKHRLKMTPAQIEQLAAKHDELEGIIDAFEKMGPKPKGRFISKTHSTVSRRT
jgi:hypothetical protein